MRAIITLFFISAMAVSISAAEDAPANSSPWRGDLLFFGEARDGWKETQSRGTPARSANDHGARLDVYALLSRNAWSFNAEYYVYKHHSELERLQLGYQLNPNNKIWLGRIHNNVGYWVTEFHHGAYIQDSINRPNVTAFEHGGIMPVHVTGLSWEFENEHVLSELFVGYNPVLDHHGLEPVDILDLNLSEHKPVISWRFTHQPFDSIDNRTGGFISYGEVDSHLDELSGYKQTIVGGFNNWQQGNWRSISALYFTQLNFDDYITDNSKSFHGYSQLSYTYKEKYTTLLRFERATYSSRKLDPLFEQLIDRKILFGLRWDFAKSQALKLELSDTHKPGVRIKSATMQWSIVY